MTPAASGRSDISSGLLFDGTKRFVGRYDPGIAGRGTLKMIIIPNLTNFLGALIVGFGGGLGWACAIWLVSLITRRVP